MPGWMKWAVALLIGAGIIVAGWRLADSRWLFWLLPTFFVANCLVLIVVVLLQSGKAADLAGAFGGAGSQTASVRVARRTFSRKPRHGAPPCLCWAPSPWSCAQTR